MHGRGCVCTWVGEWVCGRAYVSVRGRGCVDEGRVEMMNRMLLSGRMSNNCSFGSCVGWRGGRELWQRVIEHGWARGGNGVKREEWDSFHCAGCFIAVGEYADICKDG